MEFEAETIITDIIFATNLNPPSLHVRLVARGGRLVGWTDLFCRLSSAAAAAIRLAPATFCSAWAQPNYSQVACLVYKAFGRNGRLSG